MKEELQSSEYYGGQPPIPSEKDLKPHTPESNVDLGEANIPSYLGTEENKGLFNTMTEGAKAVASQAYEGLYKIPGVNRIVGKLEIAYNRFWADRHEEKAVALKDKIRGLDTKSELFDKSRTEIETIIEDLRRQNIPGVESLQLKLKDIEEQKRDALNERDRIQSKFEARENKVKIYTNERDRVADKLIGRYNEKLVPMEKELETLQSSRDQVELLAAALEAKQKEQEERLDGIEKRKAQIEEALRKTGMSEKQIAKFEAVKTLGSFIAQGRENIREQKEEMTKRKAGIEKRIAKVDERANPYRDKREEFNRIKEKRPIDLKMPTRQRGEEFQGGGEETMAHTREEATERYDEDIESIPEATVESTTEVSERATSEDFIAEWNKYLKENHPEDYPNASIDPKEFLKATTLSRSLKLKPVDFKNIIDKYYKVKKIPVKKLREKISKFTKERTKTTK